MRAPALAASATSDALRAADASGVDVVGAWAISIVHGDIEDISEQQLLEDLADLARSTGHLLTVYGTNDTTAYVFDAAGGRTAVMALQGAATLHGRFWWRLHTRFGGDA